MVGGQSCKVYYVQCVNPNLCSGGVGPMCVVAIDDTSKAMESHTATAQTREEGLT